MIRMFCDVCGKETIRNYLTEPLRVHRDGLVLELKLSAETDRITEVCLDCVMVMVNKAPAASMLPTVIVPGPDSDLPLEELDLTVRCYNVLKREGFQTVGDIQQATLERLQDMRNFSSKNINELEEKLRALGIPARWIPRDLPDDGPNYDREA